MITITITSTSTSRGHQLWIRLQHRIAWLKIFSKGANYSWVVGGQKPQQRLLNNERCYCKLWLQVQKERQLVDITTLIRLPGSRVERYLGHLNFFFIRESTCIREVFNIFLNYIYSRCNVHVPHALVESFIY